MKTFIRLLSSVVRRAPLAVLIGSIVLTVVFGAFVPQQEQASGNEGFSPDSEEFVALQTIDEIFEDSSEVAVQIVFSADGDDLITAEGLRTYLAAREAVQQSRASELLVGRPDGDIVGFFDPVLQAFAAQGIDPATATDEQVKGALRTALGQLPPDVAELVRGLYSTNADLSEPSSPAGLMVVFLNLAVLEDDPDQVELQAIQVDMAEAVREATAGGDVSAEPFSFALLFANQDEFQQEVGRLFGTAFLIIIVILGFVFWIHPKGRLSRLGALRRASADVGLALAVILLSIVWMNGIGVLFGPKYLGIIGDFNELLQIIPILLVGLGVDYAIHLTSRYREEIGSGLDVVGAATRAARTVGVALVLATVTTAVGFLTNIFSPVTAIKDFGILATVGIGAAFILMLTFVPSVRILLDRRAQAAGRLPDEAMGHSSERLLPKIMGSTSVLAERIPAVVVTIALVLGGLGAWGWANLDTRFSFTDFVPEGSPLLETFDTITEEFGGGFGERTQVLIEGDVATVDVHNGLVAAYENMADTRFVLSPGGQPQAESPLSVIGQLATPPDQGGSVETFSPEFAQAAVSMGLQPDGTVAPGTDVAALYDLAASEAPEAMRRVAAKVDGEYRYIDVSIATQAAEAGAAQLRDSLNEDFAPVEAAGADAVPTNENIVSRGVVEALQSSQLGGLILTLGAAMALLMLNFFVESRRPALGFLTMLPVVLVVLWVFGMMALTGIAFNPVTAMIAAIAIGIGVPYTIHITHRFQEDRVRYETSSEAIRSTMTHTGGALAGSAFTTVAGFGILVTSSLKPFQQFGQVIAYAIGFAMLGAVLVLPSLLALWDRWHRKRGDDILEASTLEAALGD
ncbi:MAG: efflux RND transporter permease subunit [Acidimicrobiia bacterium]|nr:efflux RND transporter permease subunit [Acidimicrobiia bacterium]